MYAQFNDINVLIRRKSIRHLYIRVVPPQGEVKVSAPLEMPVEQVYAFVQSRLSWIRRQQVKINALNARQKAGCLSAHQYRYFDGKACPLKITWHDTPARLECQGSTLELHVKPGTSIQRQELIVNDWYRDQLRRIIGGIIGPYETKMRVKINEYRIKKMKTRWGSCNTRAQRIWLNLELAKYSRSVIEYVVVHEMVHLLEHSHNPRFYSLMDRFMPDWRIHKATLRDACLS